MQYNVIYYAINIYCSLLTAFLARKIPDMLLVTTDDTLSLSLSIGPLSIPNGSSISIYIGPINFHNITAPTTQLT